ncbi:serine hydrolase [Stenotrophomonas sp. HITSZ_GD]|uniref:serine hydrolase domain-containing protein n=1 Tax=Stenotrophomonas sp. HITSZ_GD TaxID=3037248 RepID=UPI00240D52C6|nr:serine hydrolase domain-containing protein [Stenotrophomonas sp. HITSZ_GD]MDG2524975.1 serine hydrolase [Stenotrophomonas sp. HITSZ_GD]
MSRPVWAAQVVGANALLRDALLAERQPGIAAVVVEREVVIARAAAGYADTARRLAVDERTVFELGSVTKALTAMLVFQLRDEGLLLLDAPISRYVGDLPLTWQSVTLLQLLSHTSGIANYLDAGNFIGLMPTSPKPRTLLAMVKDRPLNFAPGTQHAYSNTNYILIGLAIESVTGVPYWECLDRRLLSPLGMQDAGPHTELDARALAEGHLFLDGHWLRPQPIGAGSAWAAGSLLASLRDMERLAMGLQSGRILPTQSLSTMWADTPLRGGGTAGWSAGWEVIDAARGIVGHGGGTAGFTSYLRHDAPRHRTTVVLVNRAGDIDPKAIAERVERVIGAGDFTPQ